MKKRVLSSLFATSVLFAAAGQAMDMEKASKDARVLSNVLETVLENGKREYYGGVDVRGLWLSGQGMTFFVSGHGVDRGLLSVFRVVDEIEIPEINFSFEWNNDDFDPVPTMPIAPVDIRHIEVHKFGGDAQGWEVLSEQLERMMDTKQEQMDEYRGVMEEYREAWEEKNSENMAKLKQNLEVMKEKMRVTKEELATKSSEIKQQVEEKREQRLQQYRSRTAETLCDYAGSLRSVENDQYVTVVFEKAAQDEQSAIMVWSKKDISDCQRGTIDYAKLLTKAKSYDF